MKLLQKSMNTSRISQGKDFILKEIAERKNIAEIKCHGTCTEKLATKIGDLPLNAAAEETIKRYLLYPLRHLYTPSSCLSTLLMTSKSPSLLYFESGEVVNVIDWWLNSHFSLLKVGDEWEHFKWAEDPTNAWTLISPEKKRSIRRI